MSILIPTLIGAGLAACLTGAVLTSWFVGRTAALRDSATPAEWLTDPRDLCMTQGCPSPWTHDVHGWKTCTHHAATAARV